MKKVLVWGLLLFSSCINFGKNYDPNEVIFLVPTLKNRIVCYKCGKPLGMVDLSFYNETIGIYGFNKPLYCQNCLDKERTKPKPVQVPVAASATLDSADDSAYLYWKKKAHDDLWSLKNEDELTADVAGWHFMIKKGSKRLYISTPDDRELKTFIDIDVIEMHAYKTGIVVTGDNGLKRMFDIRYQMWGLGDKTGEESSLSSQDTSTEQKQVTLEKEDTLDSHKDLAVKQSHKPQRSQSLLQWLFKKKAKEVLKGD